MKQNYKRLIQNIGVFAIANFAARFLSFLILPLYTYFLTTEEYGTIDLVNTAVQLLFPVFSLAITDGVMRFAISDKSDSHKIFQIGKVVITVGFIPLIVASIIANYFINNTFIIIAFIFIYILQAYNSLFANYLKALDKTKLMASISTSISIFILFLNVLMVAWLRLGLNGYLISMVIGNFIGFIMYLFLGKLTHEFFDFGFPVDKKLYSRMLSYTIPLIPNAIFWWINSSLDRWILTIFSSLSMVGLYACANKIPSILATINSIFSQAWNLSLFQSSDAERFDFFKRVYLIFDETMFCCSLGIIVFSEVIGNIMFSGHFYSAWVIVPVLTCGVYFNSLNGVIGAIFTAQKSTKEIFTTTLIGSIINGLLNIPFVLIWGGIGAAIATFLSYFVVWFMRILKVKKKYNVDLFKINCIVKNILLLITTIIVIYQKSFVLPLIMALPYFIYYLFSMFKIYRAKRGASKN